MNYTNLKITDNCIKCGVCLGCGFDFLTSSNDGSIIVKEGTMLNEESAEFQELTDICAVNAFKLVEFDALTKQDFVTELEKVKNYIVKHLERKDLKFTKTEYDISIPMASGEHKYEYSSYEAAERAAEREINSKMYSQIDTIILKIITEYRIKYLKPYYSKMNEENSCFAKCNQEVSALLNKLVCILENNNLANDVPKDFASVDIFPENDIYWKMLNKGEIMSDEMISTVKNEFRSNSYSDLNRYTAYCDVDDMEMADGTDWRGNTKYKDKYCYRNVYKALQELSKDLLDSCGYVDDKIEDRALEIVNALVDEYNKLLKEFLASKIAYLDKKIALLPHGDKKIELEKYENIVREIYKDSEKGLCINGNVSSEQELFVTECNDEQFFYDGSVIKKRFLADGIVKNEVILSKENFSYSMIYGFDGHILFDEDKNRLWSYDCQTGRLCQVGKEVYRRKCYQDMVFFVEVDNIDNWRNTMCTISCCRIDGSEKRRLGYTSGCLISLQDVTNDTVYYKPILSDEVSSVKWN